VSTRLLLDEMFSPRIAEELNERGQDCVALVANPAARASTDEQVLLRAIEEQRAVVTNNVVDFERLRRQRVETADLMPPLIYTSDVAFPRNRRYVARLIDALERACIADAVESSGGVLWLGAGTPA